MIRFTLHTHTGTHTSFTNCGMHLTVVFSLSIVCASSSKTRSRPTSQVEYILAKARLLADSLEEDYSASQQLPESSRTIADEVSIYLHDKYYLKFYAQLTSAENSELDASSPIRSKQIWAINRDTLHI